MNTEAKKRFTDIMGNFTAYMSKHLPDDVTAKLEELRAQQNSELANIIYDTMFQNQATAARLNVPSCQDTGVIQYFIECGANFPYLGDLPAMLHDAAILATERAPLRHNAVQIFDEKNTGNNTGVRIPYLDWQIIPNSDECTIYAYLAGGGCSLPGTGKVFMPSEGYEGVVRFIFDLICNRGINACPPLLVGVGIAGSVEVASILSKRALMRPIGSHNSNARGAEFERLIEDGLNRINIGPNGVGGVKSVMGVNVEQAARHPSCLAAAVNVGCWAHRRAGIHFKSDLSYEIFTHKGVTL
ncbi:MAG: L(+)-tartrate dehydratase subunit alpha [Sutterellaceae bacterium]|nr:L(+)-tartrate dehydratase subunit alpha [Sutterellaceae bacterium]